jgi:hypothetical protein
MGARHLGLHDADAIVLNLEHEGIRRGPRGNGHFFGPRMAGDVGQRFLQNAKHGDVAVAIPRQRIDAKVEAAPASAPVGEFVNVRLDCRLQAEVIEDRRAELRRNVLGRLQHPIDQRRHRLHALGPQPLRQLLGQP